MKQAYFLILTIIVFSSCSNRNLIYEEANTHNGFNYPYYLLIPEIINQKDSIYIVVEPNNSGFVSDDFNKHIKSAKKIITNDETIGVYVSHKLNYPVLVPVFPRSEKDWTIYPHALDKDVILQKDTPLERIDLQLLAMIKNARSTLNELGIKSKEEIILTGFSASGTFANRFTAIHPSKVKVVAAGGLNGLLFLPIDSIQNEKLDYPIGTNDFQECFKKPFDSIAFKKTPQFLFMGKNDDNDAVKYRDAYNTNEKDIIYKVIGENMLLDRWEKCIDIYKSKDMNTTIKTYEEMGHGHDENIREEILDFIKLNLTK